MSTNEIRRDSITLVLIDAPENIAVLDEKGESNRGKKRKQGGRSQPNEKTTGGYDNLDGSALSDYRPRVPILLITNALRPITSCEMHNSGTRTRNYNREANFHGNKRNTKMDPRPNILRAANHK